MIGALARKFFGSANDRRVKGYQARVDAINALEPEIAALSDDALQARTAEFKKRLAEGETLDDLLPEAFAMVREAAKRTLGQRHFDVQLIGGMVLHEGDIAEMKTGEGKTLVATLAVYLNALAGKGVHVVTVNDYLARRDSDWMGQIYRFLGLTVGVILHGLTTRSGKSPTPATSPTAPTTNSASTISAITWSIASKTWCSAAIFYAIVFLFLQREKNPLIVPRRRPRCRRPRLAVDQSLVVPPSSHTPW